MEVHFCLRMYYCITEKHNITIIYNFVRVVKTNVQEKKKIKRKSASGSDFPEADCKVYDLEHCCDTP